MIEVALIAYGIGIGVFAFPGVEVGIENEAGAKAREQILYFVSVCAIAACWPVSIWFFLHWYWRERRRPSRSNSTA